MVGRYVAGVSNETRVILVEKFLQLQLTIQLITIASSGCNSVDFGFNINRCATNYVGGATAK